MRRPAAESNPAPTNAATAAMARPGFPVWLMGALLVLVTILAYQPVWLAGFIWDDDTLLVANPLIKASDGISRVWFRTDFPMTLASFWLEWRWWGQNPLGYHLVNVLLHALSTCLLWRVLTRLNVPGAWLAAAVFAVHPVNVESVAWIAERKNTLAMFFFAWTLLCYQNFECSGRKRWYWAAFGSFGLALLSKTAVAPLPLVLLGLAWWRRGRIERRDLWHCIPFFAAAVTLGLFTVWFQYEQAIGLEVVRADSFWARLAGAGWAVWFYLYKALWPLNLMFVYPRWSIDASKPLSYLPGLLAVTGLAVCWHYRRHWGRALFFALGYFVVMLLPILGFLNIYFMRYSLVADHWQYFSIVGPIALTTATLTAAWESLGRANPRLGVALGGALILGLGVLTWKQSHIYADLQTLWQDTVAKNPACSLAHNNLGATLDQAGQIDAAISQFQASLRLEPDDADAHYNLGNAFVGKGQIDEAIGHYQEALRLKPVYAKAHNNLGAALDKKGQIDEAIAQYQEALRLKPDCAEAHNNLGTALYKKGQTDEAISQYQEALRLKPAYPEALVTMANTLDGQGKYEEAIRFYQAALKAQPDQESILNNLAWLLATCPNARFRNGPDAVRLATRVCELTGYAKPLFIGTLAAAQAEAGDFQAAIATAERAAALASALRLEEIAARNRELIQLYRQGQPFHEKKGD